MAVEACVICGGWVALDRHREGDELYCLQCGRSGLFAGSDAEFTPSFKTVFARLHDSGTQRGVIC